MDKTVLKNTVIKAGSAEDTPVSIHVNIPGHDTYAFTGVNNFILFVEKPDGIQVVGKTDPKFAIQVSEQAKNVVFQTIDECCESKPAPGMHPLIGAILASALMRSKS